MQIKFLFTAFILLTFIFGYGQPKNKKNITTIQQHGLHYQKHNDLISLKKVIQLIKLPVDSLYLTKILGEPIDMGFEYRYLATIKGDNCSTCAIFKKNNKGYLIDKFIVKCCE